MPKDQPIHHPGLPFSDDMPHQGTGETAKTRPTADVSAAQSQAATDSANPPTAPVPAPLHTCGL